MFTGIIEEIGTVKELRRSGESVQLAIAAQKVTRDARPGDSIAVNGTCLTVVTRGDDFFTAGLAPETVQRTNLGALKKNSPVNLERALLPSQRMGGHFVQGHIDGTGILRSKRVEEDSLWLTIAAEPGLLHYIVPKGFIALDGVSLTVVDVDDSTFSVMLVAYTQAHIILPEKQPGYRVNIEVDILGKYIEKLLAARGSIDENFLKQHGFA